jgi:hypothetical protein
MKTRTMMMVGAVLIALPVQAAASIPAAAGDWTAWYGCWRAVETEGTAPLVCVLPGEDESSVRIATIEDGAVAEETLVRADGVARPIAEGGCTGTESAKFSSDRRRIFTRAELSCNGLGRLSTGVLAMVSEVEWIDAQALTVNGQHAARTIRYRLAEPSAVPAWVSAALPQGQELAQETARLDAAMPLDIDAVVEASRNAAAPVVEAMLAQRQHGFGLNAAKLARLDEEGVPASTIDVMVALSYPSKFAVAPQRQRAGDADAWAGERNAARSYVEDCYDPFWTARRYGCYSGRYGYDGYTRSGMYGYSPYGYDPYGWNYGSRPVVVIVRPGNDDEVDSGGSVVKGRGYTRGGAARGTAAPRGTTETRGASVPVRSEPKSTTTTTTTRSTPSSSSGGTTETPTRTAKPRGGGGNDN